MAYEVTIRNFEGPLDLLLQLVERSQLTITNISLAAVTEQYLDYIRGLGDLDAHELQQFVALASRLIYIKSLALLPNASPADDPESQELAAELAEYAKFRAAASLLRDQLLRPRRASFRPTHKRLSAIAPRVASVSLDQLQQAMTEALSKLPPAPNMISLPSYSLGDLSQRCLDYAKKYQPASFQGFLGTCSERLELIVAFLAVLELIKSGQISVSQEEAFGDMILTNEHTRTPAAT